MTNLKAVATYPDSLAAVLDRKKLEDAGIPAEVFHHQQNEVAYTAVSSASLMVAETDLERATTFLNTYEPEPEPFSTDAPEPRPRILCPKCDSQQITSNYDIFARIGNFFDKFTIPMPWDHLFITKKRSKKCHHCHDCGYRWIVWFNGQY